MAATPNTTRTAAAIRPPISKSLRIVSAPCDSLRGALGGSPCHFGVSSPAAATPWARTRNLPAGDPRRALRGTRSSASAPDAAHLAGDLQVLARAEDQRPDGRGRSANVGVVRGLLVGRRVDRQPEEAEAG